MTLDGEHEQSTGIVACDKQSHSPAVILIQLLCHASSDFHSEGHVLCLSCFLCLSTISLSPMLGYLVRMPSQPPFECFLEARGISCLSQSVLNLLQLDSVQPLNDESQVCLSYLLPQPRKDGWGRPAVNRSKHPGRRSLGVVHLPC